jgi:hypothetical protein
LRLIRSIRRCSFSSAVLARLRGGRLVFGSGSAWPHDLRFFAGLAADDCGTCWMELGVARAVVAAVDGVRVKSGVFMLSGSGVAAAKRFGGDRTPSAMMYVESKSDCLHGE